MCWLSSCLRLCSLRRYLPPRCRSYTSKVTLQCPTAVHSRVDDSTLFSYLTNKWEFRCGSSIKLCLLGPATLLSNKRLFSCSNRGVGGTCAYRVDCGLAIVLEPA